MKMLRNVLMAVNGIMAAGMLWEFFDSGGMLPARAEPENALDALVILLVLFAANAVVLWHWPDWQD